MDKEHNIEQNTKRAKTQYFIDRRGKVHKYKGDMEREMVSVHYQIAHALYPDSERPVDILMNLGWIMVGSSCYHAPIIHKKPTQAQINKLDSLGLYLRLTFLHDGRYVNYDKYQILL